MNAEIKNGVLVIHLPIHFVVEQIAAGNWIGRMTPREKQVLDQVIQGKANKEIAANLCISERTVKFNVSALLRKLKCHSRYELRLQFAAGLSNTSTKKEQ